MSQGTCLSYVPKYQSSVHNSNMLGGALLARVARYTGDAAARELAGLDAVGQAELVRRREVTPLELVDAAIERIERVDPRINAVVVRTFEAARRAGTGLVLYVLMLGGRRLTRPLSRRSGRYDGDSDVDPVNDNLRTRASEVSAPPIGAGCPVTTLTTPAGRPTCSPSAAIANALSGVSSDGLMTTGHPAASAAPTSRSATVPAPRRAHDHQCPRAQPTTWPQPGDGQAAAPPGA